jgi:hypothetical protein
VAYLLDTNVALRWALPVDPLSPLIREAVFAFTTAAAMLT